MTDWRTSLLKTLGYRPTRQNLSFLDSWQRWEGGHTANDARFNWLNTTKKERGALGAINSVGVQKYDSFENGVRATAATLKNGRYGDILKALASGDPYANGAEAGLQVWVSGSPTGNPGYAEKVLGRKVTGRNVTRRKAAPGPVAPPLAASSDDSWEYAMSLIFDDDPEMAIMMQGLDPDKKDEAVRSKKIVDPDGSLQPVPPAPGDLGEVIQAAMSQLGKPYVFGSGPDTSSFDCSDLIQWAYKQIGISIPRTTGEQQKALPKRAWKDLQPGDLVMKTTPGGTNAGGHVVMYIGNGKVIAAPYTGTVVQVQPLSKFQGGDYHVRYVPRKGKA